MNTLYCKRCEEDADYFTQRNGPHVQAKCKKCNNHLKFIPQLKTVMPYEQKPGDVSIFKNNTENPKAPQYTGTCITPDGTTYRISLWIKEGQKGKFFSGKLELPREKESDGLPF